MPQSLSRVYIHLVFSTKQRQPFLSNPAIRSRMFAYMAGILRGMKCPVAIVNGTEDHIHALFQQHRTLALADIVRDLKRESNGWAKETAKVRGFRWQEGYGAFSVSHSKVDQTYAYIETQERHHKRDNFQDEFRALLRRHGLEWDERFVWD